MWRLTPLDNTGAWRLSFSDVSLFMHNFSDQGMRGILKRNWLATYRIYRRFQGPHFLIRDASVICAWIWWGRWQRMQYKYPGLTFGLVHLSHAFNVVGGVVCVQTSVNAAQLELFNWGLWSLKGRYGNMALLCPKLYWCINSCMKYHSISIYRAKRLNSIRRKCLPLTPLGIYWMRNIPCFKLRLEIPCALPDHSWFCDIEFLLAIYR